MFDFLVPFYRHVLNGCSLMSFGVYIIKVVVTTQALLTGYMLHISASCSLFI